ncbi:hypothetical protein ANN_13068 [Periplaneta americana]|uniref:PiggyBac transposable element-derived protein domain-containing protein n=1 Tax=Periplaneta americana TaxID=6978 RepID=A0ABQ8TKX7_PERAM|nr:hypothetical protein ANN_13068 [Periplaneta americana]
MRRRKIVQFVFVCFIKLSSVELRNRAIVNDQILNKYSDNLESELKDVPPTHIRNFDETNLSDYPGKMRVITKRGCKYPEAVKHSSKAAVSIMMYGMSLIVTQMDMFEFLFNGSLLSRANTIAVKK